MIKGGRRLFDGSLFSIRHVVLSMLILSMAAGGILPGSPEYSAAFAQGLGNCGEGAAAKVEKAPFSYTAPAGQVIVLTVIKAGSQNQGQACFPLEVGVSNGCYGASGLGTATASVTRIGAPSRACKDIGHVEFYTMPAGTLDCEQVVPRSGTFTVLLQDTLPNAQVVADELSVRHGLTVTQVYEHIFKGFYGYIPSASRARLAADPRVVSIVQSFDTGSCLTAFTPGMNQVGLSAMQAGLPQEASFGLRRIGGSADGKRHTLATKGAGIGVAVLDTGVDTSHPDLGPVVGAKSCIPGALPTQDAPIGHGTHVAGIIAARDNSIGVVGVAPAVNLYAVRVVPESGSGNPALARCGLEWVAANASKVRVVNMSLAYRSMVGAPAYAAAYGAEIDLLHRAVRSVERLGIVIVAGAGRNDGTPSAHWVPGSWDEVIGVSAFGDSDGEPGGRGPAWNSFCTHGSIIPDDSRYPGSSTGAEVDIAAPGVCVLSTMPGGLYLPDSGQSMAAPHIAGAAALYLEKNPSASPAQVKAAILGARDQGIMSEGTLVIGKYLRVTRQGSGNGTIRLDPAGIVCPSTCAWSFGKGTSVTLTASPDTGSEFTGWSGDCSGAAASISVSATQDRHCTATFSPSAASISIISVSCTTIRPSVYTVTVSWTGSAPISTRVTGTASMMAYGPHEPIGFDVDFISNQPLTGSSSVTLSGLAPQGYSLWAEVSVSLVGVGTDDGGTINDHASAPC